MAGYETSADVEIAAKNWQRMLDGLKEVAEAAIV